MRLRLIAPIITAIIIIALLLFGISQCEKKNEYRDQAFSAESGARKVEAVQTARISALSDSIKAIRTLRSKDSTEHLRVSEGLRKRNSDLTRKYTQAKAEIKPISDSIPSVKAFEMASDSLLAIKDSIILAEQRNNLVQYKSFSDEINKLHGVIDSQGKISDAWRVAAEQSDRKATKQEKRKRFWRSASIVLAGVVGVLAVSQ